jgi:cAMP phosphodiesterase
LVRSAIHAKLCLTQGQIEEFCRSHRGSLRQEGYSTFFLFEANSELLVARVYVASSKLQAVVHRFGLDHDYVWSVGNRSRVVVQQQTA